MTVVSAPPGSAPPAVIDRLSQPVAASERLFLLDALRGFALLGILLVNMTGFMGPIAHVVPGLRPETGWTALDHAAQFWVEAFASTKFYNLFAFLFGVGFALQMIRAEQRGADVNRLFVRRFAALLLIGLGHAFLIWSGDVLVTYALTGFVLLLCRRASLKVTLIVAGVLLGTTALSGLIGVAVFEAIGLLPNGRRTLIGIDAEVGRIVAIFGEQSVRAYGATGGIGDVFRQRAIESALGVLNAISLGPLILCMFLIGLQAGRFGVPLHVEHFRPLLRRIIWWGVLVGVPANLFYAWAATRLNVLSSLCALAFVMGFAGPLLALTYAAALTLLLLDRPGVRRLFTPFAAAGRMALSNYLLQSIVCTTLAYNYGFGWFGKVRPFEGVLIAFAIYALQLPLSVLWLRRFQFGPAEWLWRALTYNKRPPLRRRPPTVLVSAGGGNNC